MCDRDAEPVAGAGAACPDRAAVIGREWVENRSARTAKRAVPGQDGGEPQGGGRRRIWPTESIGGRVAVAFPMTRNPRREVPTAAWARGRSRVSAALHETREIIESIGFSGTGGTCSDGSDCSAEAVVDQAGRNPLRSLRRLSNPVWALRPPSVGPSGSEIRPRSAHALHTLTAVDRFVSSSPQGIAVGGARRGRDERE